MATVLEEVSKEGFREYSSDFQVRPFRVVVLTDWSVTGQGVFSHCCWFWPLSTWFCCFSGPGAETRLRTRCHLQGLMLQGVVVQGLVVFPLLDTRGSLPWCTLHLAHHSCSARVYLPACNGLFLIPSISLSSHFPPPTAQVSPLQSTHCSRNHLPQRKLPLPQYGQFLFPSLAKLMGWKAT